MKISNFVFACGLLTGMVTGVSAANADGEDIPTSPPDAGDDAANADARDPANDDAGADAASADAGEPSDADAGPPPPPPITWRTDIAIVQGSGCTNIDSPPSPANPAGRPQDAWVIANGADLSIVFTKMSIDLPALPQDAVDGDHSLAGRKSCSIRVPVSIAAGYFISQLTQTLTVTALKSDNVDIDGASVSRFFNQPASNARIHAFAGPGTAFTTSQLSATSTDAYDSAALCGAHSARNGLFQSNLAISGTRATAQDDLIVNVDSIGGLRWDISVQRYACGAAP